MKTIRLILVFIILPLLGSAQQYYTRDITIDDGLPSNTINCLFQDSLGYLWVGTDAGIGIYDGTDFRHITKKDGLASNDVRAITPDDEGNLWFACYDGGITRFDGKRLVSYTAMDGLRNNFIRRLYYSTTYKTLFVGADDGFYTFKEGKFTFYGKANGKLAEEHEVLWFMEGKGFVYIFPYKDNAYKFYPSSGLLAQMKYEDSSLEKKWWAITSALVTSRNDTVWGNHFAVSDKNGYRRISGSAGGLVFDICEDSDGNVWLPIWGSQTCGISCFNGKVFEDYITKFGLDDTKCKAVHFDKNTGTLWIGTDGKGLKAVPKRVFTYYPTDSILKGKFEYRKLFYYRGAPCILCKDQIAKFNLNGKAEVVPISILEKSEAGALIRTIRSTQKERLIKGNTELWRLPEFYDAAEDNQGNLWVSTTVGFYRLSADLKAVTKVIPIDTRYGDIVFDGQNNLFNWGMWTDNLNILADPNLQNPPYRYQKYSYQSATLPKDMKQMLPIGQNVLFSSLYGGLYLWDGKTFAHLNKTSPELPDNVSAICLDHESNVVYCTNTGEIGIGALEGGKFIHKQRFDSVDQSYGRNFLWVICDRLSNIYVGTNRGMLVIQHTSVNSTAARSIRFFSNSEGFQDFSAASPMLDDKGDLWLASQRNLVRVDTKALTQPQQGSPRVLLTKVETTDSVYAFEQGQGSPINTSWKFPYSSNNITFHFTCVNLLNPEKDRFSVQLEGFDKSFKETGSDRKAVYTNLPAGRYKFVVLVYNLNTLQEKSQTLFEFTISPPYWQTWWFYNLISILLIFTIIAVYYYRERRLRETAKAQLENAELQMQALQAQMNPHFMFNVFNSLQRYILERDVKKGVQLLGEITSMIRQTFTLASKKQITLREEVAYLESYLKLEQGRYADKFQYEIITEDSLNLTDTLIPSMLIQPMVENAVKHGLSPLEGTDGHLKIVFSALDGRSIKCTIEDNGIGLKKSLAAKHDNTTRLSQALSITQRRIELFRRTSKNGSYSVILADRSKGNPDQTGTVVTIILPTHSN